MYNVKRTDFYSWQQNLRVNLGFLPKHLNKSRIFKGFYTITISYNRAIIDSFSKSQNIPITNMLIKELLRCYYFNHIIKPQPNLQFNCTSHYVIKIKQLLSYMIFVL